MPASWRMNRPPRPVVKATIGGNAPSKLGPEGLLDFQMQVTPDGETLSAAAYYVLPRCPMTRQTGPRSSVSKPRTRLRHNAALKPEPNRLNLSVYLAAEYLAAA